MQSTLSTSVGISDTGLDLWRSLFPIMKWPHEFVLSGWTQERIQYDHLTTVQWVAGYCRMLSEERDLTIRSLYLKFYHCFIS